MNNEFIKDLNKVTHPPEQKIGRRYEPVSGEKKHNARIKKESVFADEYKNLPFSFSAPKGKPSRAVKMCGNCNNIVHVNKNTVNIICSKCKTFTKVIECA